MPFKILTSFVRAFFLGICGVGMFPFKYAKNRLKLYSCCYCCAMNSVAGFIVRVGGRDRAVYVAFVSIVPTSFELFHRSSANALLGVQ